MLFNSYEFIFFYLPVVAFGFFWIARTSNRLATMWLVVASLFFYGWWNSNFVLLLLMSVSINYAIGYAIGKIRTSSSGKSGKNLKTILVGAISGNIALLCYFKYSNFFLATSNQLVGSNWAMLDVVLPLGISFFTFTQIAFLVDVYRGRASEYNFTHYLLFVTYFPHLIAGPVLHHSQMMPQFGFAETYKANVSNINIGITIFTIGLFKKVIFADQFALYSNPIFAASAEANVQFVEAWIGAIAFTLQLYFDFSGYSDMAIGISRIFNIKLPINFNSPYKSSNIIEFWRRWHMTLSSFLRDYLYIPLGGNRDGEIRRYCNLLITMLLGGLWHGANWTFVLWGGLHGIFLVINHLWQWMKKKLHLPRIRGGAYLATVLTFIVVVVAWVPFRADNIDSALRLLSAMGGINGFSLSPLLGRVFPWLGNYGVTFGGFTPITGLPTLEVVVWLPVGFVVIWGLPNAQQWVLSQEQSGAATRNCSERSGWRPLRKIAVLSGICLGISILGITRTSQFLYFQF